MVIQQNKMCIHHLPHYPSSRFDPLSFYEKSTLPHQISIFPAYNPDSFIGHNCLGIINLTYQKFPD